MKEIEICVIVILGVVGLAWAGTDPECPAGTWDNATTTGIAPNEITTHQCEYCAKGNTNIYIYYMYIVGRKVLFRNARGSKD